MVQLLAPLGKAKYLNKIIEAGADSLYAGLIGLSQKFGHGLNHDELKRVLITVCEQGKSLYLSLNINFKEETLSIPKYLKQKLDDYYSLGLKGIILKNFQLMKLLSEQYPELLIIGSIGLSINSTKKIQKYQKAGMRGFVFGSTVTSIDEISELHEFAKSFSPPLQTEIMVHGTRCIGGTGNCRLYTLFSDTFTPVEIVDSDGSKTIVVKGDPRTGGGCYKPCLCLDDPRLLQKLSIKTISKLKEKVEHVYTFTNLIPYLMKLGINIFKLQGREWPINLVVQLVQTYRKLIDSINQDLNPEELETYYSSLRNLSNQFEFAERERVKDLHDEFFRRLQN
ncbi:MAG: peptidase U32 family protein [Candidatus Helarchaeota archaeon]